MTRVRVPESIDRCLDIRWIFPRSPAKPGQREYARGLRSASPEWRPCIAAASPARSRAAAAAAASVDVASARA
jgi:hypothetical protein